LLVLFSLAKLLPFQWEESIALRGSAGEHALFEISVQSQVKLTLSSFAEKMGVVGFGLPADRSNYTFCF
jgi:hypothetical protein